MRLRFYASSFFCVCGFLRFRFFVFSFSEICVFVLWNMHFRSLKYASSFFSKNENDVNLAVASTVCHPTEILQKIPKCPLNSYHYVNIDQSVTPILANMSPRDQYVTPSSTILFPVTMSPEAIPLSQPVTSLSPPPNLTSMSPRNKNGEKSAQCYGDDNFLHHHFNASVVFCHLALFYRLRAHFHGVGKRVSGQADFYVSAERLNVCTKRFFFCGIIVKRRNSLRWQVVHWRFAAFINVNAFYDS